MNIKKISSLLESQQIGIYFGTIVLAGFFTFINPGTGSLEGLINPALALMLFATFLQVPLTDLKRAFGRGRFLMALLSANFLAVPILVAILLQTIPKEPMLQMGILLVLLTPCIDYVVTFSHLGGADARLLLAATPGLLLAQILLLPLYLRFFLGDVASGLIQFAPFFDAFIWLIFIPLVLALIAQTWATKFTLGKQVVSTCSLLPVPATALAIFTVIIAVTPQIGPSINIVVRVIPIYIVFAVAAPLIGWTIGRVYGLDVPASRAVAFSTATRNSLVVLPIAFAVSGGVPIVPAIVVTQTLVELVSELVYVRILSKLDSR